MELAQRVMCAAAGDVVRQYFGVHQGVLHRDGRKIDDLVVHVAGPSIDSMSGLPRGFSVVSALDS